MRLFSARSILLALVAVAALVVPATLALGAVVGERGTQIISAPLPSTLPTDKPSSSLIYTGDGARPGSGTATTDPVVGTPRPADNIEFSMDNRVVRYAVYDSEATNLVKEPATTGQHQVYAFQRASNGSSTQELLSGTIAMVSVSNTGEAGDGNSVKPSIDGQTKTGNGAIAPHCVVFQSQSTNLAKGDKSPDWDVYLRDLSGGGKTSLVSTGRKNARDGVISGQCEYVTFESGGKVFVKWLAKGSTFLVGKGYNPDQQTDGKGVAYDRRGQVYYREFFEKSVKNKRGKHVTVLKVGKELLVSSNASSKPGNGPSSAPSVNDNGVYIAFESHATDLCDGSKARCGTTDKNGAKADVYRRTMEGRLPEDPDGSGRDRKVPTADEMQMISYDGDIDHQTDLDSDQVKISGAGEQACFRSFGVQTHNLKFGADAHRGPFQHIYFWNFPRERMIGKFSGESRAGRLTNTELMRKDGTAAFNYSCAISNRGNFLGWTSDTEAMAGELNGRAIPDTFMRFMGGSDENLGGDLG
jgi:hypothetical protein